jgi:hypothetical protein
MITGAATSHLTAKIPTIYLEGKLPLVLEKSAVELGLRDGQVVQGTIESRIEALRLHLQGAQKGAFIDLPKDLPASLRMASGDAALFRVQVLANGNILLRPLQTAPAPAASAGAASAPLPGRTQHLSFRPPDMQALGQLLRPGMLESMLQGQIDSSPELGVLQQWLQLRPSMAKLTPEKLQQAMHRSGFMTEGLLTQGLGSGLLDLKSVLRQLLRNGTAIDKDGLLKDSLDDIESRQLLANEGLDGREWAFSMMLPFADAEPVALRLMRGRHPSGQAKPPWVIHLHTRTSDLGELWLQTRINDETQIDMVMWAEREDVVNLAQAMADHLERELDSAGLHMTRLQIIHGQGPQVPAPHAPPEMGSLLDVQT